MYRARLINGPTDPYSATKVDPMSDAAPKASVSLRLFAPTSGAACFALGAIGLYS